MTNYKAITEHLEHLEHLHHHLFPALRANVVVWRVDLSGLPRTLPRTLPLHSILTFARGRHLFYLLLFISSAILYACIFDLVFEPATLCGTQLAHFQRHTTTSNHQGSNTAAPAPLSTRSPCPRTFVLVRRSTTVDLLPMAAC